MQHMRSNEKKDPKKKWRQLLIGIQFKSKGVEQKTKNQVNTNVPKPPCRSMQKEGFWTWKTFKKLPEKESFAPPKKPNLALCHQFSGVAQLLWVFREDPSKTQMGLQYSTKNIATKMEVKSEAWVIFQPIPSKKNGGTKICGKFTKASNLRTVFRGVFVSCFSWRWFVYLPLEGIAG